MYDKKEYDKMLDFYEKTVTSNQDAKVRLNLDVILHRLVKNASSEQKQEQLLMQRNQWKMPNLELKGAIRR